MFLGHPNNGLSKPKRLWSLFDSVSRSPASQMFESTCSAAMCPIGLEERIREMFLKVELMAFSYDTAWVAMVPSSKSPQLPCFPEFMDWLLENQLPNGSWGLPHHHPWLIKDALSFTLACVLALKRWSIGKEHVEKGVHFVGSNFVSTSDERQYTPIGFDLIFPGMIEYAENMGLNLPLNPVSVDAMLHKRDLDFQRYVKSRNEEQLRKGTEANTTSGWDRENATSDGSPIVPCGLIAWSLFNNTYSFTRNELNLNVNKKGISWKSDRDHKFGDDVFPKNFQTGTLIGGGSLNPNISLNKQEDLIVWLRTAALPTFRKLYGKIEVDLEANNVITVVLLNNYNTHSFGGKKKLVLSTTSLLGGKNDFLGIAYLTVGSLCLFLAMATFIIYLVKPRQLGDPSYLSWNRNPSGH